MPPRRLAFVRLAEGGRRHEAPSFDEAILPKSGLHLVVACVDHTLRRIAIAQENEPPASHDQFALAVVTLLMMGAMPPGKIASSVPKIAMRLSERRNLRARSARRVLMLDCTCALNARAGAEFLQRLNSCPQKR